MNKIKIAVVTAAAALALSSCSGDGQSVAQVCVDPTTNMRVDDLLCQPSYPVHSYIYWYITPGYTIPAYGWPVAYGYAQPPQHYPVITRTPSSGGVIAKRSSGRRVVARSWEGVDHEEDTAQVHRLVGFETRPVVLRSPRRDPREDARATQEGTIVTEDEIRKARFNGTMIAAGSGFVGRTEGVGKVVDYEMDPTVTIEKPDGSRFTVLLDRCELATTDQIIEAQKEALKKLRTGT